MIKTYDAEMLKKAAVVIASITEDDEPAAVFSERERNTLAEMLRNIAHGLKDDEVITCHSGRVDIETR